MHKSLQEVHRSVRIPQSLGWFKKLLAFAGPGYLVAVGYMDPGNWATDLAGGSQFGYALLSVIIISNFCAMLLQHLSLKLGIASGKDLARASHDFYSPKMRVFLWITAEIAIIACDLAEVIGSAIALNLLFHIPILLGVLITAADTLVLLYLQNRGIRYLELLIASLITVILGSFIAELFFSHPDIGSVLAGMVPSTEIFTNREMLYIAIGILGATVMPHNLYLHSALVLSRTFKKSTAGKKEAIKFATIDSTVALLLASFVNAAILLVAAAAFHTNGLHAVAEIQDAYHLLTPVLGASAASVLFAVALLAAGHNSTITGTLAGQVVMEGFIQLRIQPWQRRLLTRGLAIIPAVACILLFGNTSLAKLLVLSQVILSIQLPFAMIPLVLLTGNKRVMGAHVNTRFLQWVSGAVAAVITLLNIWLLVLIFHPVY